MQQLPLALSLRDEATFDNFYAGDNASLITMILQILQQKTATFFGQNESVLYLWGQSGVGRTHLLQAACHAADAQSLRSTYLPMRDIKSLSPAVLENLEQLDLVCIDDIEAIAGESAWEEALFHLYNRLREKNTTLMIAAEHPLADTPLVLKDLISRLRWGLVYQVFALTDEQKISALQQRAWIRGFQLSDQVGAFLLRRCARTMPELYDVLETLDKASLAAQRKITVPFVKEVVKNTVLKTAK